jgi:hypothetical protein
MGQEQTTTPFRLRNFMGINQKVSRTAAHPFEATDGKNFQITDRTLQQRSGSTKHSTNLFTEQTDSTAKPITGLYETVLGTTTYQVGVGGDAFKQFTGGAWVDKTGSVTITDDDDNLATFSTFWDGSASNEIIIVALDQDAPIKWTGSGDAAALGGSPPSFKHQVVHKNKLWVSAGDVLYFSGLRDGESWDTSNDLVRFEGDGKDITGLAVFGDRLIVFKPGEIFAVSGSSNRDLFVQSIVKGEGCISGYSIQEIESRRYGNILAFLSSEGFVKAFNGSQNLLTIGDHVQPLWDTMNRSRFQFANSMKYEKRNQYWVSATEGSGTTHDHVFVYDYFNDVHTNESTGHQLSTSLLFDNINMNAAAIFNKDSGPILVTGDYAGELLKQDDGALDEGDESVTMFWDSAEHDFGAPTHIKLLTDLHISTSQTAVSTVIIDVFSRRFSGRSTVVTSAAGGTWGVNLWSDDANTASALIWGEPSSQYFRCPVTMNAGEGGIYGRFMKFSISHQGEDKGLTVEELIANVSDLGDQPEYGGS